MGIICAGRLRLTWGKLSMGATGPGGKVLDRIIESVALERNACYFWCAFASTLLLWPLFLFSPRQWGEEEETVVETSRQTGGCPLPNCCLRQPVQLASQMGQPSVYLDVGKVMLPGFTKTWKSPFPVIVSSVCLIIYFLDISMHWKHSKPHIFNRLSKKPIHGLLVNHPSLMNGISTIHHSWGVGGGGRGFISLGLYSPPITANELNVANDVIRQKTWKSSFCPCKHSHLALQVRR